MSSRFQRNSPRVPQGGVVIVGLLALAIVVGLTASRGGLPAGNLSVSLLVENTRTPTPLTTPINTATIAATQTPIATLPSTATGVPSVTPSATSTPSLVVVPTGTLVPTRTVLATGTATVTPTQVITGPVHYVSKLGNNSDGSSWANAWSELGNINWTVVRPGDTVFVDGGTTSMTYTSELLIGSSGTASLPITIRLGSGAGRDGQVVIFGGRSTLLPYCEQASYTKTPGTRLHGIDFVNANYVTIDGTKWSGIKVLGHDNYGIGLNGTHNSLKYIEVTDNGQQNFTTYWRSDQPGIHPSGSDFLLDHMNIHDNGQDAIQTGSALTNMTVQYSWLHNSRTHPVYGAAVAAVYCMHSDGMQIYGNGTTTGLVFDHNIHGPGFLQGTLLGQSVSSTRNVNNVTFTDDLFTGDYNQGIGGYAGIQNNNWTINRVTVYMPRSPNWKTSNPGAVVGDGYNQSIKMDPNSTGLSISNTVIYDGNIVRPSAILSNNCQFNLISGTIGGTVANPQFANPPPVTVPDATGGLDNSTPSHPTIAELEAADYTITNPACVGKGSSVTSVAQLLAQ